MDYETSRIAMLDMAQSVIEKLGPVPGPASCLRCDHFDGKKRFCKQFNMAVPAENIQDGCQECELRIPF